jgi:hypothetical protein
MMQRKNNTHHQHGAEAPAERYCVDPGCPCGLWLARADERLPEVWHVAASDGATYRIAASAPICPRCGGELAAHPEGTGAVAGAADNPFVGFLRTLNKARAA